MTKRMSKTAKDNQEFFEALYKGEWLDATDFERGQAWFKSGMVVTDSQQFTIEFLNGYQDEERNTGIEPELGKFLDSYKKEEV